ncbi:hypothetical protein BJ508DRAFT_413611 [Ascobolus immersus RN42]|uniref:Uncharacterized protein n=1 Tax=Ascobolus immersus RN42 TaxID=1160509 RepID=A0A3N4IAR2_ASCIM|nr:hypothetical protein BJ508DRAFT_413611 [Ascobolus immersus RN42]
MRHSTLLFLVSTLTAVSAVPQQEQSGRAVQPAKRYVGLWDSHEADVLYEARLEPSQKGRKGKGRKHWWKFYDDEDEEAEQQPTESSKSTSTMTLPVEKPTPEILPPDGKEKQVEDVTFLPILDEDGQIKTDPELKPEPAPEPEPTPEPTPSSTIRLTSTQARKITITPTSTVTAAPSPKPTKAVALKPTYPPGISDPVPKDAWLMEFASKVAPYWNYTEKVFPPCWRYNSNPKAPLPDPNCTPTCESVRSHTIFAVFNRCMRHEICAFATFVLPDSECPGRVNSFETRCPLNEKEFSVKSMYKMTRGPINSADLAKMLDGTSDNIEQCIAKMNAAPAKRRSIPFGFNTHALATRDTNTALALYSDPTLHTHAKRAYQYRQALNNAGYYRSVMIAGPPDFYGPHDLLPKGGWSIDPFSCGEIVRMVFTEYLRLNGTRYRICEWPHSTKDFPEERCPGAGNPGELCPQTEEELVKALAKEGAGGKDPEKIKELLKKERDTNGGPCVPDKSDLTCGPDDWMAFR